MGLLAGYCNDTGTNNVFLGTCAGYANTGSNNIYAGRCAGRGTTGSATGGYNIGLGRESAGCISTGIQNIFYGTRAGRTTTTGSYNFFAGACAGYCNTTGSNNLFAGLCAGYCNTTGCNNLLIGYNAGVGAAGLANITTETDRIILGNSSHTCAQIQVAWSVVSDCRDKLIHCRLDKGRDFLSGIKPVVFSFKDRETNTVTDTKKRYGFIAQEVLQLEGDDPVIVGYDSIDKLNMTQEYLIPILVNAVNELNNEVNSLRPIVQEVATLKQQIQQLMK